MGPLTHFRNEIDEIDDHMVELLIRRLTIVEEIGALKKANGLSVYDPAREQTLLERLSEKIEDVSMRPRILSIMKTILASSKILQNNHVEISYKDSETDLTEKTAGYAGIPGSYGETATYKYFNQSNNSYKAFATFPEVANAVLSGEIDYGVLPVENTTTGAINEVYDLIREKDLFITGEILVPVVHHLIGYPGVALEEIREIRSHPQGLEQCTVFLSKLKAHWIPMENTAVSVRYVAESGDKTIAAIGSERAAQLYGLEILSPAIQNSFVNTTRFVILSNKHEAAFNADSTSMVLTTRHTPGSLHEILGYFASEKVNLFRIESRPVQDRPWEYYIYLDAEGRYDTDAFARAMQSAQDHCPYFKFLGSYRRGFL